MNPGQVLIDYGDEWQKAWDEHIANWKPIPPESDYNNLTLWSKPTEQNGGKSGYVRAEALNGDYETPIRTVDEQATDPYPHSVYIRCFANVNHAASYLFEPETVPYFTRDWDYEKDLPDDADDRHHHRCNITERYLDDGDSGDDSEDDGETRHKYLYTVEMDVRKQYEEDTSGITERHEIEHVPREAIEFVNQHYTSDVFLKNSFRHTMQLPDDIFPKAWMRDAQQ